MATNPLIGAGWNVQPGMGQQNQMFGNPLSLPQQQQPNTNPGGYSNPQGANEINRNMGLTNMMAGQMKNFLAPQFTQQMGQYGQQAGNTYGQVAPFFRNLMNLGSPYYQQKQLEGFQQGNQQNQNAAAMARQQLASQGYGATPSGANAAMLGGMQQQGAQNLAENYLQNLFQNENMQMQGAQGLGTLGQSFAGLAGMFNPTQLLGGTGLGSNVQAPPSFFQNMNQTLQGIGSLFGGAGQGMSGAKAAGLMG